MHKLFYDEVCSFVLFPTSPAHDVFPLTSTVAMRRSASALT
jgi:hypothetical protein